MAKPGKKNEGKVSKAVWPAAEECAVACGCELVDVEYQKEGGDWVLRVYIDREPPIDHDACERVSRMFSDKLDELDPIEHEYTLEISSPGLERPLRKEADFQRFAGSRVCVKLYAPLDGKKEYTGELLGLAEDKVLLRDGETERAFPLEQLVKVHLLADI